MIPPHGPKDAKIVFVIDWGEKDDAKYNLPLVGAPGDEMSRILAKAGIRRNLLKTYTVNQGWTTKIDSEVYVTLLHKEYVDKEFEFIHHYFDDAKATVPKPEFIQLQKDLYQELAVLNPNVIVACGEYSLRVLTGHRGIGNWRGSIVKSELLPGKKVVCMHRPSNIISSWDLRPLQILDCKK